MFKIKLYETYNKAKDLFAKPILKWKFGLWKNDPCLPVWRRGPVIKLYNYKYGENAKCHSVKNSVLICTGQEPYTNSKGETRYNKKYAYTKQHKLPGGLKPGDIVWNRDIRKKLRKFGLSWIKPRYQLPTWLAFHIFNYDVCWKTKWNDTRFEFPPQFTIVAFGFSLSFWLVPPKPEHDRIYTDHYWEGIIDYGFYKNKDNFNVVDFLYNQGYIRWTEYSDEELEKRKEIHNRYYEQLGKYPAYDSPEHKAMHEELDKYAGVDTARPGICKCFIREDKQHYLEQAVEKLKSKHKEHNWIE